MSLFIDLSDFITWQGYLTGIQRTVYNVAREALAVRNDVVFVVHAGNGYQRIRQSLSSVIRVGIKEKPARVSRPSREELLKRDIKRLYHEMPLAVRVILGPSKFIVKPASRKGIAMARHCLHKYRMFKIRAGFMTVPADPKKKRGLYGQYVHFSANDQLLIMGDLWNRPDQLTETVRLRYHHKVSINILVYDLIPIYQPNLFPGGLLVVYARYLFETLSIVNNVFAISRSTANDIEKFMLETGIKNSVKPTVIRLGDVLKTNVLARNQELFANRYENNFIICVGTLEVRKNHALIYMALRLAAEKQQLEQLPKLYLIGREGWLDGDTIYGLRTDPVVRDKVEILQDVGDEELSWLYEHALFSVYPSRYEGWGLPVAESLVYGLPCITSNTSSMPEIAPGLVELVSPYDTEQFLEAMLRYADPTTNRTLRRNIQLRYSTTSWLETTKTILGALNESEVE